MPDEIALDSNQALAQAIRHSGSQSALARQIGVSQNAVSRWVRLKRPVPPKYALAVEKMTGVSRHDLNPEAYPREEQDHSAGVMAPVR